MNVPMQTHGPVVARVKIMSELNIAERRLLGWKGGTGGRGRALTSGCRSFPRLRQGCHEGAGPGV